MPKWHCMLPLWYQRIVQFAREACLAFAFVVPTAAAAERFTFIAGLAWHVQPIVVADSSQGA
jgi:hypothetical protein